MKKILYKMERGIRRFAVPDLMKYIVFGMALIFLLSYLFPYAVATENEMTIQYMFDLRRDRILDGQVWRLITFLFLPPITRPFWIILSLYFYYSIGRELENKWGSAKFNLYYLIGVLGVIVSAMTTGYSMNTYLNYSLFFAYAILFPNTEFYLFFIIPIKVKYLALFNAVFYIYVLFVGTLQQRVAILIVLVQLTLFFGDDFFKIIRVKVTTYGVRKNFKRNMKK